MSLLQLFTATDAAPFSWSLVLSGGTVIASIIPLGAARSAANFEMKDMAAPRAMFERFPAWGKRASWAHQNSFEAFTLQAPAALLALIAAQQTGPLPAMAVVAAFAHPVLRLAYIAAYVGNVPPARGLCWATGLLCSGILYSEGLKALLGS
ncbi:mapeg family protein [Synechococcus sp. KORDI-100]|uniref:MAPEG family protein n=1 Tax=Synechococcus sp. KORDI-100 TaxID=1280380 RepID=UPI0004E03963|nr:MAPEG family protein [Synechococcus sp. KORDI-100]AII42697.1 mapeg family protein [Synechococcus sp. KORDI-100]